MGDGPISDFRDRPPRELYHRALAQLGSAPLPVGVHSPGHVAETDAKAHEELWPPYEVMRNRIAATVRALGASRFDLKYSAGTLRHELMLRSVELYGREVIPRVRRLLAEAPAVPALT